MTGKFIKADALQYIPSLDNNSLDPFEDNERGFHDCQKPVALLRFLIELTTKPGHIVFDPFAGSGSTLVAAKSIRRGYLGLDLDDDYVQIGLDRLEDRDVEPPEASEPPEATPSLTELFFGSNNKSGT